MSSDMLWRVYLQLSPRSVPGFALFTFLVGFTIHYCKWREYPEAGVCVRRILELCPGAPVRFPFPNTSAPLCMSSGGTSSVALANSERISLREPQVWDSLGRASGSLQPHLLNDEADDGNSGRVQRYSLGCLALHARVELHGVPQESGHECCRGRERAACRAHSTPWRDLRRKLELLDLACKRCLLSGLPFLGFVDLQAVDQTAWMPIVL
jgi:hypothetical protein